MPCRLEYSRQWAMRAMHEAEEHDANSLVTLTVNEDHLADRYVTWHQDKGYYWSGSLEKEVVPLFMKRLRKAIEPNKVRVLYAGEYGEKYRRPHYHALLFGHDFRDKCSVGDRNGYPVWRSGQLDELWSDRKGRAIGFAEIGTVTFESAAYVARYVTKKVTGDLAAEHYRRVCLDTGEEGQLEPEFARMSRRPGLGARWFDKWSAEVYAADEVPLRGGVVKPPRYYDRRLREQDEAKYLAVKFKRGQDSIDDWRNRTPRRVAASAAITEARAGVYAREVEP